MVGALIKSIIVSNKHQVSFFWRHFSSRFSPTVMAAASAGSNILSPPSSVRGVKTAGVIIIGDEILKGTVKDENIYFLCQRFHSLGVRLGKISVVGDTLEAIASEVQDFSNKFDVVITTGGIGPTHDDITYEGVAKAFNDSVVVSSLLQTFWSQYYPKGSSVKMSSIPATAEIIYGDFSVMNKGKFPFVKVRNVYIFPGIPSYLRAGFSALEDKHFRNWETKFHSRLLHLNVDESLVVKELNETVEKFKSVELGSYPIMNNPYFVTKITLESLSEEEVESAEAFLRLRLNQEWIEENSDFVGNAPQNLSKFISSLHVKPFYKILQDSMKVIDRCYENFSEKQVFVCFNGGKDCTALLHLVHCHIFGKNPWSKLQVVYIKGKDPFTELEEFINSTAERYNLDLTVVPGPIKPALEKLLKDNKEWKAVFMGTRRSDPHSENMNHFQETDSGWPKLMRVNPLLDWSYEDVWTFLKKLNVPYCSLYDKGYTSLGSKANTKPNEDLAYYKDGALHYRPAYMLQNQGSERNGRL